jgi:AraC family transcriptional regulator
MSSLVSYDARPQDGLESRPMHLVANLMKLLEVARDEFERDSEAAKASITRATVILRSELQRHEAASKVDGGGELAGWQVQRLRAYIDGHLSQTIHVKDLSAIARRSTAHFCRAFKRTFGQTPHAYLTERRLERAKTLMLESGEQLSVIALSCGFTDQAHLSKLFRQHTGETPGAWRRRRAIDNPEPSLAGPGMAEACP